VSRLRVPPSTWSEKRVYSEQPTCCTDKCDRPNERSILDLQIVRGIFPNSKIFLTKFFLKVSHFAHFGHFGPSKRVYSREVNIMTCSVLLWLCKYNPLSKFFQRDLLTPERILLIWMSSGPFSYFFSMITPETCKTTQEVSGYFLSRILFFWTKFFWPNFKS
jgi:hypothetical protein